METYYRNGLKANARLLHKRLIQSVWLLCLHVLTLRHTGCYMIIYFSVSQCGFCSSRQWLKHRVPSVCVCALQTNSEGHCFPSVILLQGQSVTSRPNALVVLWDKVKAPVKKKGSPPVFLCGIMRTALTPPAGRPRLCFLSSVTSRWWRRENIHQETCGRYFIPQTPGDISEADWKLKWPFRACHGACNVICCPTHTPATYSHLSLLSLIAPA